MTRRQKRTLGALVLVGAVVAVLVVVIVRRHNGETSPDPNAPVNAGTPVPPAVPGGGTATRPAPRADTQPAPNAHNGHTETQPAPQIPDPNPDIAKGKADARFKEGMALAAAGKLIPARDALSEAVFSGKLSSADADTARAKLWDLAQKTIFRGPPLADDLYTSSYVFQAGDTLADRRARDGQRVPGVISAMDLRVPSEAILMVNGGMRATQFQAGRGYKTVKGPFHCIVYKSEFVMDVYLDRPGSPKTFIRRLPVGIGKNGSTPAGSWLVDAKAGGKGTKATWYPPPSSGLTGPIYPGDDNYAFGEKGLWIQLKGLDEGTEGRQGYGIHSTNKPESIGHASSLGCIRLGDEDIEFVFGILYEGHSTVWIRE